MAMDNKKVANAALEEVFAEDVRMTLKEHDHRYHHDFYKQGDSCLFREQLAKGDVPDEALAKANELEAAQFAAKEQERQNIADRFKDMIPQLTNAASRKKYGATLTVGDQNKNGDVTVIISMFPVVKDEAISKDLVKRIVEGDGKRRQGNNALYGSTQSFVNQRLGLGYKLREFKVGTLRGNNVRNGGKKLFVVRMHKDAVVGALSPESVASIPKKQVPVVEKKMSDAEKSLALRRYGLKIDENGKVAKRISREEETPAEHYFRMVQEGRTVPKNNAEIKRQKEIEQKAKKDELDSILEDLGIMGSDFDRKMGF